MRSGNMSPSATSWTFGDDARQFSAAPEPRPPQPTRPILIVVSWPEAWTRGTVERNAAVAAPPDFTKSRREMGSAMMGLLRFRVPCLRSIRRAAPVALIFCARKKGASELSSRRPAPVSVIRSRPPSGLDLPLLPGHPHGRIGQLAPLSDRRREVQVRIQELVPLDD